MALTNQEILKYSRHLLMPQIGIKGQKILKKSCVLVVGAGGLGCTIILYLTSNGIGNMTIVDDDVISEDNLPRQILYTINDVGKYKVDVAKTIALSRNPKINCHAIIAKLTNENVYDVLNFNYGKPQYDIIIDGTDNPESRYLINDLSLVLEIPWVYGSALSFEGQLATFNYHANKICYRCLFPQPPPPIIVKSCNEIGVLGCIPGLVGLIEVLECIKVLLPSLEPSFVGKLLIIDALSTCSLFREIKIRGQNPNCLCSSKLSIETLMKLGKKLPDHATCAINKLDLQASHITINQFVEQIKNMLYNSYCVIDVRERHEIDICQLGDSNILDNIPKEKLFYNIPYSIISTNHHFDKNNSLFYPIIKNYKLYLTNHTHDPYKVYVLCRRGIDSVPACKILHDLMRDLIMKLEDSDTCEEINGNLDEEKLTSSKNQIVENDTAKESLPRIKFYNVLGGLHAWTQQIEPNFPIY